MLWPRRVWWVAGEPSRWSRLPLLLDCVGCGVTLAETAESAEATQSGSSASTRLVYCSTCLAQHARHASLALSLVAIGGLAGIAVALALPVFWPSASLGLVAGAAALAASVPTLSLGGARRSPPRVWSFGVFGAVLE